MEFVNEVNKLLNEGLSLTKIAKMWGISRSTIARRCGNAGYIYCDDVKQYILKEEYYEKNGEGSTPDINKKTKESPKAYTYNNTKDIIKISEEVPKVYGSSNTKDISNVMTMKKYFKNVTEEDLIKFKKLIDNIDKLVDIVDKKILILDIPYEEAPWQTTIKVNKAVYDQFKEKCKNDYPNYNIKDLLTHALQDFIERY